MKYIYSFWVFAFIFNYSYAQLNPDSILVLTNNNAVNIGFKPGPGDNDTTFAFKIVGDSVHYNSSSKHIAIVDTAFILSMINNDTLVKIYTDTILAINDLTTSGWPCADSNILGNNINFNGNDLFIRRLKLFTHNEDSTRTDSSGYAMQGSFVFKKLKWEYKLDADTNTWCYRSKYESEILPSLHATINDTISVAGVKMILLNTTLDYNSQTQTFIMYGDSILFMYSSDTLQLGFGDVNNPGLEYKNGNIEQILCLITDSVNMFGLDIYTDSMFFEFHGDSSAFFIYCDSLELEYGQQDSTNSSSRHRIYAGLGNAQKPGLLIKNGQLIHFTFSLSDSIHLMGLDIDMVNVNLEYNDPKHLFEMYGGPMTTVIKNDTIGIDFGTLQQPGLAIENGVLKDISIGITGDGKLLGFAFNTDSLHLDWMVDSAFYGISSGSISLYVDTNATNKDSISLEFIYPGLVIKGGEIKQLNAQISDNFSLRTLLFETDSLQVGYDEATDNIQVFNGDIIVKYGTDSLNVQCGTENNPGIKLKQGKIDDINISIGSEINIKKFECRTYNLKLIYVDSSDIIGISGDSIFLKYSNDSLLGEAIQIEFRNNDLDILQMQINKDFSLKALDIHPKPLTFSYNRDSARFEVYDSVLIIIDSNEIHCDFGNQSNPGLILQNGAIKAINIAVRTNLKIGGMDFIVKNAGIEWPMHLKHYSTYHDSNLKLHTTYSTTTHDTLALFGDFEMKELWKADFTLGTAKQPGIEIYKDAFGKSKFRINNLSLELDDVSLEAVTLEKLIVKYNIPNVDVTCDAIIGDAFEAEGKIDMNMISGSMKVDDFLLGFDILPSKEGIPIGDIGIFLQGADAGYDFVNNKFTGGFRLSDGAPYEHGADKGFMLFLNGNSTITKDYYQGNLHTYFGAYLQNNNWYSDIGDAQFQTMLNWKNNYYSLTGEIKIPTDYGIKINGEIKIKNRVKVFYGNVEMRVPSGIPVIGGKDVANASGALIMYLPPNKSSFAAGWADFSFWFYHQELGIKYDFYSHSYYKIGASDIKNIKKKINNAKGINKNTYAYEVEINSDTYGDILIMKIALSDSIDIKQLDIAVLGPNGIYPPVINLFDSVQGFYLYNPKDTNSVKTNEVYLLINESVDTSSFSNSLQYSISSMPKIEELQRGIYEIIVQSPASISTNVESALCHSNPLLNLIVSSTGNNNEVELTTYSWIPQVTVEPRYDSTSKTVSMITHAPDNPKFSKNAAEILLYYDNDSLGYDGALIDTIHTLTTTHGNGVEVHKTIWQPRGHKPGEHYYFYAVLRDSLDVPLFSKYSQAIVSNPRITGTIVNVDTNLKDVGNILVYIDLNRNGDLELNRIPQYNDSISANDTIPFRLSNAEPTCFTDSLGNFYFETYRHGRNLLDTGIYQIQYYLPNGYKTDANSPFKQGDLFHYTGQPFNLDIWIKEEN